MSICNLRHCTPKEKVDEKYVSEYWGIVYWDCSMGVYLVAETIHNEKEAVERFNLLTARQRTVKKIIQ